MTLLRTDYHTILDSLPALATAHFCRFLLQAPPPSNSHPRRKPVVVHFSHLEQAVLLAVALQRKSVERAAGALNLDVASILRLLYGVICKVMKEART
mmetsp:Transcript_33965/g.54650  ORF Transcript_33965/g.54650 Transcript_33965/m.54650 type:complete len:97 (+) Transcript_33965:15-305(+)